MFFLLFASSISKIKFTPNLLYNNKNILSISLIIFLYDFSLFKTMKLACLEEILVFPLLNSFKFNFSISLPAKNGGLLINVEPSVFSKYG